MGYRPRVTIERLPVLALFVGLLIALTSPAGAYDRYSIADNATNCRFCHGDFRQSAYTSLSDGQNWGNLHNIHRFNILNGDCATCHEAADEFPVFIDDSDGGEGLPSIGCIGCHGRAEDGTGIDTDGFGLALQQRHHRANAGTDQNGQRCVDCHADANPAVRTAVGEEVLPPYYANPGIGHPNIPNDPCNPPPDLPEDFAGLSDGLDNDGDLVADQADADCQVVTTTPGEVSGAGLPMLLVVSHNPSPLPETSTLTVSYGTTCQASDNTLEFGSLDQVSTYGYSGQACNMTNSGTYVWNYPDSPGSLFFVVVGNDGSVEGSYGLDGDGVERPEDAVSAACPLPQSLGDRCD